MTACLLCRSEAHRVLQGATAMVRTSFAGRQIVRCLECGFDYLRPVPQHADDLYEEGYFAAYRDAGMVFPTESSLHPRYVERLRRVQEQRGPGRLLEVGVGHGGFMQLAAQSGWRTTGVELSRYAAQYVQQRLGLPVICGSIETASLPDAAYDLVHLSHVLEHLIDPLGALRRIRGLLAPGGVLAIEVPNELENLYVKATTLVGLMQPYAVQSTHVSFFSPPTLRLMLEEAGFDVRSLRTLRDATDPVRGRRMAKRLIGAVERRIGRGPLIEAVAVMAGSPIRTE